MDLKVRVLINRIYNAFQQENSKAVEKGTYARYDSYTLLNIFRGRIYQECANNEFKKEGTRPPNTVGESSPGQNTVASIGVMTTTPTIAFNLRIRLDL